MKILELKNIKTEIIDSVHGLISLLASREVNQKTGEQKETKQTEAQREKGVEHSEKKNQILMYLWSQNKRRQN